jgi:abortive infection bacteriophage resistance protein
MGNMEVLYDNLLLDADKRLISKKYNEPAIGAFKSYMSVLREVRNACAHGNVLYDLHLVYGVITGAACPSFAPGTQQTLSGALRVIDFMLRQISTNRAKDMWNELFRATERLYSKVPSIRPLIEQKTGIFVPKKKSLGKDIGRLLTKLFGK